LRYFYNDNPKNLSVQDEKRIKSVQNKFKPIALTLDLNNGQYTKTFLKNNNHESVSFQKDFTFKMNDSCLLMIENGKRFRLSKIIFPSQK